MIIQHLLHNHFCNMKAKYLKESGIDCLAVSIGTVHGDYRGEPNPLAYPATGSEFGILDYCGFPKDEAYFLQSWWTDEPVLHILPHWNLEGHEGEEVSVWVRMEVSDPSRRV